MSKVINVDFIKKRLEGSYEFVPEYKKFLLKRLHNDLRDCLFLSQKIINNPKAINEIAVTLATTYRKVMEELWKGS